MGSKMWQVRWNVNENRLFKIDIIAKQVFVYSKRIDLSKYRHVPLISTHFFHKYQIILLNNKYSIHLKIFFILLFLFLLKQNNRNFSPRTYKMTNKNIYLMQFYIFITDINVYFYGHIESTTINEVSFNMFLKILLIEYICISLKCTLHYTITKYKCTL